MLVVVALTVTAVVVVDISAVEVVAEVTGFDVVVRADVVVDVEEDVVDVAQDANTRDTTMRQVNIIQITPFFI